MGDSIGIARSAPGRSLPILNYSGTIAYRNPYHQNEVVTGEAVGLTKAEWAAINSDYKGTRVSACGTHRVRTTMMAPGRRHQLVAVYLTDSKLHPRPTAEQIAQKAAEEAAELQSLMEARLRRAARAAFLAAEPFLKFALLNKQGRFPVLK